MAKKPVFQEAPDPDDIDAPVAKKSKLTNAQLEQLYDDTSARILQDRGDFLLPQIVGMVGTKKWINLRPEYQRRKRWDNKRRSRLIESVLMNIPIPPVFLFEKDLGRYEVMDGQQRLTSIIDFYNDDLVLTGLQFWPDLNGRTYSQCPVKIRKGLDRRRISSVTLLAESKGTLGASRGDIRLQVFGRLNTGGMPLNPQELRNCVYTGPFNDLIVRLARIPLFNEMWDMPIYAKNLDADGTPNPKMHSNKLFATMGDCQIVLRFFAFRDPQYISGAVRTMLDTCMQRNEDIEEVGIAELEKIFSTRLEFVSKLLGKDAFKLPIDNRAPSRPLFDAIMVAVDDIWEKRASLLKNKAAIRKSFPHLFANRKTYNLVVGKANTADAIKARIRIIKKFLLSHI